MQGNADSLIRQLQEKEGGLVGGGGLKPQSYLEIDVTT